MTEIIKRGTLIFWTGFEFEDHGSSDKLLIILGSKVGQNVLAVLTTSKARGRKKEPGCFGYGEYFFVRANADGKFKEDTWIELYRPQEIQRSSFDGAIRNGSITVVKSLPDGLVNAIRNCLNLSHDITPAQINLLE
jgi:hypothetical protein